MQNKTFQSGRGGGGGVEYSNLVLFKTAVYMVDFKKISCAEHEYLNTPLLIKTGYFQNVSVCGH